MKREIQKKRGQISTEYLIILAFVTFIIVGILGTALIYSSEIKDSIKFGQIESFAKKIIASSESVFYSGEPSITTINAYLPDGVTEIEISNKDLTFTVSTSSGVTKISYTSSVTIQGSISASSGLKKLRISATPGTTLIQEM